MSRVRRLGFTVMEMSVMAAIGLILLILIFGLIRYVRLQDGWTSNRLEGAAGGAHVLDAMRYDAARSRYRDPREMPSSTDGSLQFRVSGDSPLQLPAKVAYGVDGTTQFVRRTVTSVKEGPSKPRKKDDKTISSSRFQKLESRPASTETSHSGLYVVDVAVGAENQIAGPRSRTTTVGAALLLREQNLRARFPHWADKGSWTGEETKLPEGE